jgi:hypothetical protein
MKGALLAIALTLAPSAAEADCSTADLRGTWDAYVFGAEPEGTFIMRCVLRFNGLGRLRSDSSCDDESTLEGDVSVNSSCRFTAAVTQTFPDGEIVRCDYRATLAKSKDDFAATGECDTSEISLVNAIKQ